VARRREELQAAEAGPSPPARGPEMTCELVSAVAFSPDGRRIAAYTDDLMVRVWDTSTAEEVACLGGEGPVVGAAFSPDGRLLAAGAEDGTVWVWDVPIGAELTCLRGHHGPVLGLRFGHDGRHLLSASADGTTRVWELAGGTELACAHGGPGQEPAHLEGLLW